MTRQFDLEHWPPEPITQPAPHEVIVDVTPVELTPHQHEGKTGSAVCPHCEVVVSREQARVTGTILPSDERHDHRPVFPHLCKAARGVVHLYADAED